MTERKPPGMKFTSWIDQQIAEAEQRGAFDNLPGAGKPIPARRDEADYGQAWLRDYARREGIPQQELLPEPLKLRKEIELLTETLRTFGSERDLREAATDLNRRILEWRRIPVGPPVFVPLLDVESLAAEWRQIRETRDAQAAREAPPAREQGWWRRLIRGQRQ
ncbi:MAG TPA: DUF1992 domain-containing protein [Streptosporangiaceae bacterium]|nr:DUF1992 domain-containing protein [Streptosporangiaceae bacterium]